jgi:hypothetical protein
MQVGTIMLAGKSQMNTKVCSKCGIEKPFEQFSKKSASKDGYRATCKVCEHEYHMENKERLNQQSRERHNKNRKADNLRNKQYYQDHKEHHAVLAKTYREDHREEIREGKRQWKKTPKGKECEKRYYQKNKDIILPKMAEYYLETKEEHNERSIKWAKENPEKTKEIRSKYGKTPQGRINSINSCNRRRELLEHGDGITLEQWIKILKIQDHRCNGCGRKFSKRLKATEDHIIPLSKGGLHEFGNIQALCGKCNSTKNANLDKEYIHTWITEGVLSG